MPYADGRALAETTCLYPALSYADASVFIQLQLKSAVHISFSRSIFQMFFGRPLSLRPCVVVIYLLIYLIWSHQETDIQTSTGRPTDKARMASQIVYDLRRRQSCFFSSTKFPFEFVHGVTRDAIFT